jgi:hypothetical protein
MTPSLQEDGSGVNSEADSHPCQDQKQDADGNKVSLPMQHRETMDESDDRDRRPRHPESTRFSRTQSFMNPRNTSTAKWIRAESGERYEER